MRDFKVVSGEKVYTVKHDAINGVFYIYDSYGDLVDETKEFDGECLMGAYDIYLF